MKEFRDKVAVVTGAGSGIGRGLAQHCAREGMKVVLAGIKEETLIPVHQELEALGATSLVVRTDVSKAEDVENLALRTIESFGAVHLLFNNAGVTNMKPIWENSIADWRWVMGVNQWGVIHGIKYFVPLMLEQDSECHVVNNASFGGLMAGYHLSGAYAMTKHAVVSLSESLYYELAHRQSKINVSVLCSGFVQSRIMEASRNRPTVLQTEEDYSSPEIEEMRRNRLQNFERAMPTDKFVSLVFDAIRNNQFYVFSHPEVMPRIQQRFDDIMAGRNPTL